MTENWQKLYNAAIEENETLRGELADTIAGRDSLQDALNREGLRTAEFMSRCGKVEAERDALKGDELRLHQIIYKLADDKAHVEAELDAKWQPIKTAPKDGSAFLAYGRHTGSPKDAAKGVEAGDHWWAIVLYDVYREIGMGGSQFVFAKDGAKTWSPPTHWMPLPAAPQPESKT